MSINKGFGFVIVTIGSKHDIQIAFEGKHQNSLHEDKKSFYTSKHFCRLLKVVLVSEANIHWTNYNSIKASVEHSQNSTAL